MKKKEDLCEYAIPLYDTSAANIFVSMVHFTYRTGWEKFHGIGVIFFKFFVLRLTTSIIANSF